MNIDHASSPRGIAQTLKPKWVGTAWCLVAPDVYQQGGVLMHSGLEQSHNIHMFLRNHIFVIVMQHNLQASRNLNGTLPIFRHKKHDNSSNTNLPQLARVCAIAQQTLKTISPPFGGLTHRCRHHCLLPGHCHNALGWRRPGHH